MNFKIMIPKSSVLCYVCGEPINNLLCVAFPKAHLRPTDDNPTICVCRFCISSINERLEHERKRGVE